MSFVLWRLQACQPTFDLKQHIKMCIQGETPGRLQWRPLDNVVNSVWTQFYLHIKVSQFLSTKRNLDLDSDKPGCEISNSSNNGFVNHTFIKYYDKNSKILQIPKSLIP